MKPDNRDANNNFQYVGEQWARFPHVPLETETEFMERLKRVSAEQKEAERLDHELHKAHNCFDPNERYAFLDEFNEQKGE